MKPVECRFEAEALSAVLQSRWPQRVDAPLRAHIAACAICSDVVAVASAIDDARDEMRARAVVPDPGRVWWLAQLRARREAAKAVGHPITVVQAIAFACAVGLLAVCFGASSTWLQSELSWTTAAVAEFKIQPLLPSAKALIAEHSALVLAMAALLFLVPAAVYLAVLRD